MKDIKISAILAMAENRVIGKDNRLPWYIPADLKHFKQTTMGKPVIMGRKSYESLGKPLPGRANIIVSRQWQSLPAQAATPHFRTMESVAVKVVPQNDLLLVSTIEEAIETAKKIAARDGLDEIFITGGAQIYDAAMPYTDRIYLSVIHRAYDGDTLFSELNMNEWLETSAQLVPGDPAFTIKTLDRK